MSESGEPDETGTTTAELSELFEEWFWGGFPAQAQGSVKDFPKMRRAFQAGYAARVLEERGTDVT
jgi:hypothetical protein